MRAVLDTNVLVRAMLSPGGSAGSVIRLLRNDAYIFLYSAETIDEIGEVLGRPRMVEKYGMSAEKIRALRDLLELHGEMTFINRRISVCRDPKDDMFLEVAVNGRADVLVSGDEDLLVLHPFEGLPIVEPYQFLAMF